MLACMGSYVQFAMFSEKQNWYLAAMFVWGVVGGLLSVTVTILNQAGVLKT